MTCYAVDSRIVLGILCPEFNGSSTNLYISSELIFEIIKSFEDSKRVGNIAISFLACVVAAINYSIKSYKIYRNGYDSKIGKWLVYSYSPLVIVSMGGIMFYYGVVAI